MLLARFGSGHLIAPVVFVRVVLTLPVHPALFVNLLNGQGNNFRVRCLGGKHFSAIAIAETAKESQSVGVGAVYQDKPVKVSALAREDMSVCVIKALHQVLHCKEIIQSHYGHVNGMPYSLRMPGPAPLSTFLTIARAQAGKPYQWAAKGPDSFDCSGLITYSLLAAGGPDIREMWNAGRLYAESMHVDRADIRQGDWAFYGSPHSPPSHVMVVMDPLPGLTQWSVWGATGGNHTTLTLADAVKLGACVKARPGILYRPDLIAVKRSIRIDERK